MPLASFSWDTCAAAFALSSWALEETILSDSQVLIYYTSKNQEILRRRDPFFASRGNKRIKKCSSLKIFQMLRNKSKSIQEENQVKQTLKKLWNKNILCCRLGKKHCNKQPLPKTCAHHTHIAPLFTQLRSKLCYGGCAQSSTLPAAGKAAQRRKSCDTASDETSDKRKCIHWEEWTTLWSCRGLLLLTPRPQPSEFLQNIRLKWVKLLLCW